MAALDGVLGEDGAVDLDRGRESSSTIWVFLIVRPSSTVLPLSHSVAREELAMAEPQPKHLNLASSILPSHRP
jgi:hypothetical protein